MAAVCSEYRLHISPETYCISPVEGVEILVINRSSQEVSIDRKSATIPQSAEVSTIYGIWGVIRLLSGFHLLVITKRELVGELFGHTVWKVVQSAIYPFGKSKIQLTDVQMHDEAVYCQMLETFLTTEGFYFSTTLDLTHTQQRLSESDPNFRLKSHFERSDPRFTWNKFLLNTWVELLLRARTRQLDSPSEAASLTNWSPFHYCLPVMLGFVGIINSLESTEQGALRKSDSVYGLISRRSVHRVGTRYNCRGVDMQGNAANTVETEQVLQIGGHRFAYVQTRGSVPLYWSQKPNLRYKPSVLLGGSQLAAYPSSNAAGQPRDAGAAEQPELAAAQSAVARLHFHNLIYSEGYGRQVVVNLLDDKGKERQLRRAFAAAATDLDDVEVKYEAFDFHRECCILQWSRLTVLLTRLLPDIVKIGHFHLNLEPLAVMGRQSGAFRSNCLDSLDRTNVLQSMLAWIALERALISVDMLSPAAMALSADASSESALARLWPGFGARFNALWSDNADYCSLQYTGTPALKTDFTRTGKRTLRGMLMDGYYSAMRYYMNNFTDGFRQDSMHLFLGQFLVHDADGTPKPLTGPGGRGRRGSGRTDTEWRSQFLPLVFSFTFAMSLLCVVVPTSHWTEQMTYALLSGTAAVLSAFAIFMYGEEFVDRPRFCPD